MSIETFRRRIRDWVLAPRVQGFIVALIVINSVVLGMQTASSMRAHLGEWLDRSDQVFLVIFVVELLLKFIGLGKSFFRNPWNVFDTVVVGIALAPAGQSFSVLRALRILRALRLISAIREMRTVVESLLRAVPGMAAIGSLLLVLFYVGAVMTTTLFGETFDAWFGTIGRSMYTLFQIMTLESWSMGIVRPVMEAYPYAWVFFVVFILVTSFTTLNLFIAIIVSAMQDVEKSQWEETQASIEEIAHRETLDVLTEIRSIKGQLDALEKNLQKVS